MKQCPVESHQGSSNNTYSTILRKGYKKFIGIRLQGRGGVLQGPYSDVQLHAPGGLYGFLSGHVHKDPTSFLHCIPESECLASPIVDYHFTSFKPIESVKPWFKIIVPHWLMKKDRLKKIKVRHGDIYDDIAFEHVPGKNDISSPWDTSADCFYEVRERHVIIFTTHFSQFICSCCEAPCQGEAKILTFGSISPLRHSPVKAGLRPYATSPLYVIQDCKEASFLSDPSLITTSNNLQLI